MEFCCYPDHEYGCNQVNHCPHLGGASLGNVVFAANYDIEWHRQQVRETDYLGELTASQQDRIAELKQQVEQLTLELRVERQSKFATNRQANAEQA